MKTILSVVGARPNFIKVGPVDRALARRSGIRHVIVHTGQHYDRSMSETFFEGLDIPQPQHNLDVGSGSHAQQTGAIMQRFEPVCMSVAPDLVLVYGDVNSTMAGALVAAKLGIRVGHVEAGLRSCDWSMAEEINRVVTDRISDLLFTPSPDASDNLRAEGLPEERIHFVGNIMIDSLIYALPQARTINIPGRLGLAAQEYVVATLHRPSNVEIPATLGELMDALEALSVDRPVIFPMHPRTRERIIALGRTNGGHGDLRLIAPVGYVEMLSLVMSAGVVVTDSGGLQEETSYLGVPCITVRASTERPITCIEGTNRLVRPTGEAVLEATLEACRRSSSGGAAIARWDGKTAERIARIVCEGEFCRPKELVGVVQDIGLPEVPDS